MTRRGIRVKHVRPTKFISFEYNELNTDTSDGKALKLAVFYRLLSVSITTFFDEFYSLLESLAVFPGDVILAGDANIHYDVKMNVDTIKFCDILKAFNLSRLIHRPTHVKGHTLDVLIVNTDYISPLNISCTNYIISDHFPMGTDLCSDAPLVRRTTSPTHHWSDN